MAHFHAFCTDCPWNEKFSDIHAANSAKEKHNREKDHAAFAERHESDDD